MKDITKEIYRRGIDTLNKRIAEIKDLDAINIRLKEYNWIFLHPHSQGRDKAVIANILDSGINTEHEVLLFFANKFLNLRGTIHYIDGLFKKRPFLVDYANDIDESVVLCLQKDFHGAINILLPVIEGTLSKCLLHQKGNEKKHEVSIKELLKVMDVWIEQYVELHGQYLRKEYEHLMLSSLYFDKNQEKEILKKHRTYFTLWIKQLKDYLVGHLYLDTKHN